MRTTMLETARQDDRRGTWQAGVDDLPTTNVIRLKRIGQRVPPVLVAGGMLPWAHPSGGGRVNG